MPQGDNAPRLAEKEAFCKSLQVPVAHFWNFQAASGLSSSGSRVLGW